MNFEDNFDLKEGDFLLVDKPLTWTSFNVVNKIRYKLRNKFNVKKIKVGHAGTLDPLATGLVIVNVGKFTKRIIEFQDLKKEYIAEITFGATTASFDLESEVVNHMDCTFLTKETIEQALKQFLGEQMQVPPVFSAKRHKGDRAYEYARKGKDIELKPSKIFIEELDILSFDNPLLIVKVVCSKGTYIRSLAHDLGQALNCGAHLSGLKRTAIGNYRVENALKIEEIEKIIENL